MKKLIIAASCAVLAACSQGEAPAETEADTAATSAAAAPAAQEGLLGSYEVTNADGTPRGVTTINADGSFVAMLDGAETGRGTVAQVNGQSCFNSAEAGSAPECWTDGPAGPDGSFTSTSDDGVVVTVKKLAAAAPTQ